MRAKGNGGEEGGERWGGRRGGRGIESEGVNERHCTLWSYPNGAVDRSFRLDNGSGRKGLWMWHLPSDLGLGSRV